MKKIKKFINKIQNIGIDDKLSNIDAKRIRLINGVGFFTMLALIIGSISDFSHINFANMSDKFSLSELFFATPDIKEIHSDKWIIIILASELFFFIFIAFVLFLHYLKKHKLAVFIFCLSGTLFTNSLYIIEGSIALPYVMISFIIPIMFYSKKSKYIPFLIFNGIITLTIATYIINYSTLIILSEAYLNETIYLNIVISTILLALIINYFKTESVNYENQLQEQNNTLQSQSEEISSQRDKLHLKNKELITYEEELKQNNEELQTLNENIRKQKNQIETAHNHITDSINYAKRIQQAVFPQSEFLNNNFSDSFIFFRPRDIVSGDFYWMSKIDNKIIIVVADCTGHGVPGAFMSLLGISFLNEIIPKTMNRKAGEILDFMRQKIKTTLKQTGKNEEQKDGMDMALCIIDTDKQKLQYAGAYNPMYLIRKQEKLINCKNLDKYRIVEQNDAALIEIQANKQPLAIYIIEKPFDTHQINIQKKDKLYLFSDGFSDQFSEKEGQKFMSKKFKKLLIDIYDNTMIKQLDILNKTLDNWQKGAKQIDDILIVGIQI